MKAYNYDSITKAYSGSEEAYLDPAYKRPLLAGNQTFIKPEQPIEGHVMVFKDESWVEVVDYRGVVYPKDDKSKPIKWEDVGELPPNLTPKKPKENDTHWDEEKEEWVGHDLHFKKQMELEASYEFKRIKNYPPLLDQLDALYWDKINGTNNWVDSITKVKEKYPKPENENEKV